MTCLNNIDGASAPRADYYIEQGVDFARSFQVKLDGRRSPLRLDKTAIVRDNKVLSP